MPAEQALVLFAGKVIVPASIQVFTSRFEHKYYTKTGFPATYHLIPALETIAARVMEASPVFPFTVIWSHVVVRRIPGLKKNRFSRHAVCAGRSIPVLTFLASGPVNSTCN